MRPPHILYYLKTVPHAVDKDKIAAAIYRYDDSRMALKSTIDLHTLIWRADDGYWQDYFHLMQLHLDRMKSAYAEYTKEVPFVSEEDEKSTQVDIYDD